jgi:hypothetical protein
VRISKRAALQKDTEEATSKEIQGYFSWVLGSFKNTYN